MSGRADRLKSPADMAFSPAGEDDEPIRLLMIAFLAAAIPGVAIDNSLADEPTYHRDVAPIVNQHCLVCHREGDIAPFPLASYENVRRKARTILRVCDEGFMPPWKPKAGIGHFAGEMRLNADQLATLHR